MMEQSEKNSGRILSQIMRDRVQVLEQILMVSEKQHGLVQRNDITTLLKILARKQKFLENLDQLERALDPFRDIDPRDRYWQTEQERLDCERAINRSQELLSQILEWDRQSETILEKMKQQTQLDLKRLDCGAKVAGAYARQNVTPQSPKKTSSDRFDFQSK
ncbi:MAG: hypothetical protein ACRC10_05900 [Thermoguttaceae bacterium]